MLKGIYKAASGMIPYIKRQEITANNIANATTPGFKKDEVFIKELDSATKRIMPRTSDWQTPMIDQVYTDFSQGTFTATSNNLDVAIEGGGFFAIQSPQGDQTFYTRNGNFAVDLEGYLVTNDGYRVLGDGGPISVGGGKVDISESGEVIVDEASVGNLQVVDFADPHRLVKEGTSRFAAPQDMEPVPPANYSIRQGFLEQANIDIVKEMVNMIIGQRSYETGAKMVQIQDDSLGTLINQVGRTQF